MFSGLSAGMTLPASLSPQRRLIVCSNHNGPPLKGDPNGKLAGRYSSSIYSDDRGVYVHVFSARIIDLELALEDGVGSYVPTFVRLFERSSGTCGI
jgi:hypothetical protein